MLEEDESEIKLIYDIHKEDKCVKIFGEKLVENNKDVCKMIIDNKEYEIAENFNIENYNNNKLEIKLKGINNVTDMSYMFDGCKSLSSVPDISKWYTNNVTNMRSMFRRCSLLSSLPDISNWSTNKVTNMSDMFNGCSTLSSLPDISKWNTNNIINMSDIFIYNIL